MKRKIGQKSLALLMAAVLLITANLNALTVLADVPDNTESFSQVTSPGEIERETLEGESSSSQSSEELSDDSLPSSSESDDPVNPSISGEDLQDENDGESHSVGEEEFVYAPQPQSAEELAALVEAFLSDSETNPLPKWEDEIPQEWIPTGFTLRKLSDANTGAEYFTLESQPMTFFGAQDINSVGDLQDAVNNATGDLSITLGDDFFQSSLTNVITFDYSHDYNITIDGGNNTLLSAEGKKHFRNYE